MGPDIYSSLDDLAGGENNWQFDIVRDIGALIAMNKGLIQIENNCFLV